MREQCVKAMKYNQLMDVVYMDKAGKLTKRRIRVLKLNGEKMWIWDTAKQAKRTFLVHHVLACQPVLHKERAIL